MTTPSCSGGRENVDRSPLTGLVEIIQSMKSGEKFQYSLLEMKELMRWDVQAESAYLQQFVVVLKSKIKSRRTQSLLNTFAAMGDPR